MLLPRKLSPSDQIAHLAGHSPSDPAKISQFARQIARGGYLPRGTARQIARSWLWRPAADSDEELAAVFNDALRNPEIRAIFIADADFGAYRIADRIDLDAVRRDPKPVAGIGDITHLHLALWRQCRLVTLHGLTPEPLMSAEPVILQRNPDEISAAVSVGGRARGFLIGGTLSAIRGAIGAGLPSLDGAILLLADERTVGLGQVDRQLTQLLRSGALDGVRGVALGRFTGFDGYADRDWTLVEVLRDRLSALGVPVLGGLPLGGGPGARAAALGAEAVLDADAGTLTVGPAVAP